MSLSMLRGVWHYRGFIAGSVRREFESRYRGSLLGAAWTVLNPLAMIVVYTVIFSEVMRARLPGVDDKLAYSVFLCSGLLTWGLFSEVVSRCLTMFLDNANLLKKLSFPRICLPVISACSSLINFAIIFGLFCGFLLITGRLPGIALLAFPLLVGLQLLFAMGLGMLLGLLNVFFRDVGQIFGIALQFWFWFTPIVYPLSILPEQIRRLVQLNPLSALIEAYQNLFLNGRWPDWSSLLPLVIVSCVLCVLALALFRARSGEMVDEL
ncbi:MULTISPECIES: ABC transporter permease [Pseudomonas]|uniref:Transport permease protein n=1 Tax=Pseudomonas nitroreducens TaxID=46680 RepID=A0A246F629_PSENT|nr:MULTISPECIES: ABC transporter permease [Pseudomonas]MCG8908421.1 ABC transporter permease [Pseudomonas sp. DP-17]OWP48623.1 ABC transporter [Pseudomonas nitroreducens]